MNARDQQFDRLADPERAGIVCKINGLQGRRISIFDKLNSRERSLLLTCCVERTVKAGSILFSQATLHTSNWLIKDGLIRTYYSSPMGREITAGFWGEGSIVGGPNFFGDNSFHVWSGDTVKDSVLLAIKGCDLKSLSVEVPAIAEYVIDALSFKLHWVSLLLQTVSTESVCHRLAHLLVSLSEMYGIECEEGILITHPFTQEDLANMVSATRQWVSMTFGRFQQEGIVCIKKRRLVIIDMAKLHQVILDPHFRTVI